MVMENLEKLRQADGEEHPFGKYEEESIISLILDYPETFGIIAKHVTENLFERLEVRAIVGEILEFYREYDSYPTRGMLKDILERKLTVDHELAEPILKLVDRPSNPRDVAGLKDRLINWARSKSYGMLYDPETIKKWQRGEFESIESIFEEARKVKDVSLSGMWFFEDLEKLFRQDLTEHFTTGIVQLDQYVGDGGPSRKEMFVWMAPTGRGKSIMLVHSALANVKRGRKVLFITLELSETKTALRGLGNISDQLINNTRFNHKDEMIKLAETIQASSGGGDLYIHKYPPDEISVDDIEALLDMLRRNKNWVPDVIVIDYLELMVSRRPSDNKDDYTRQKSVATQVRGLADNTNTMVFTATQTNRAGNDPAEMIGVTKIAESYGKTMALDYLVSINQTPDEAEKQQLTGMATVTLFIAKNRNGDSAKTVNVKINYRTMSVKENQ